MLRKSAFLLAAMLSALPHRITAQQEASPAPFAVEQSSQPGILLLTPDDFTRPWVQELTEGFRDVALAGPDAPVLYVESLDAARFGDAQYLEDFRGWLRRKYAGRRIDLVVPLGEEGLDFLARKGGEPWPNVPVVYGEVGGTSVDTATYLPQATGVLMEDHFPAALAVIKQILPGTRQIALVYGASAMERNRTAGFADKVRNANLGLTPIEFSEPSMEAIIARAAQLPSDAAIFILFPATDATGRALTPLEACERIAPPASRPAFMMSLQSVGCGVVGGLVRDMRTVGRLIGEQAMARLHGGAKETVTFPISRYASLVFDARQLARWGISEARLPAGSTVRFRPPNLWRDYRPEMIAVLAVILLQALLIAGLVFEHRRRRRAETEARQHLTAMALLDRRHAMGELTASLAHELNQPLGAILRNAEAAKMLLAGSPVDLAERLEEVREIVEDIRKDDKRAGDVIGRIRALVSQHDVESAPVDINDVARESVAIVAPDAASRKVQLDLDLSGSPGIVSGDRVHLQQVLLNLMINGMEAMAPIPADRRRLLVRTARNNGAVSVTVHDTGPGLSAAASAQVFNAFYTTKKGGMGMGLSIARSIVEAHGGQIAAENNPDGGATLRFSLPARAARLHDDRPQLA